MALCVGVSVCGTVRCIQLIPNDTRISYLIENYVRSLLFSWAALDSTRLVSRPRNIELRWALNIVREQDVRNNIPHRFKYHIVCIFCECNHVSMPFILVHCPWNVTMPNGWNARENMHDVNSIQVYADDDDDNDDVSQLHSTFRFGLVRFGSNALRTRTEIKPLRLHTFFPSTILWAKWKQKSIKCKRTFICFPHFLFVKIVLHVFLATFFDSQCAHRIKSTKMYS